MTKVTGFTAERMKVVEGESVIDGEVVGNNLHLIQRKGTVINAGAVQGIPGPAGTNGTNGTNGAQGPAGKDGVGIPTAGTTGQILAKKSTTDYDSQWQNPYSLPSDMPLGFIGTLTGPAVITDSGTANTLLVDLVIPVVSGRRYRTVAFGIGSQVSGTGNPRLLVASPSGITFDTNGVLYLFYEYGIVVGGYAAGGASFTWTANFTGNCNMRLWGITSAYAFRCAANACSVTVEDIGT